MFTQRTALNLAQRFAAELQQLDLRLQKVIMFGSYARNGQREESDIDVALVSESFTGAGPLDVRAMAHLLARDPFCYIEPHTFSPAQFTDSNPFVHEIKRTGIVVGEWEPAAAKSQ